MGMSLNNTEVIKIVQPQACIILKQNKTKTSWEGNFTNHSVLLAKTRLFGIVANAFLMFLKEIES